MSDNGIRFRDFRVLSALTDKEVARSWDQLVNVRAEQIDSGKDITFNRVVKPSILASLGRDHFTHGIDVGCGSGHLTASLVPFCDKVVGIDISEKSVALASQRFAHSSVSFSCTSLSNFSSSHAQGFDLVVANMFLMDTDNLDGAVMDIRGLLSASGKAVVTIPHPCFFPKYRGYASEAWFDYNKEIKIEADFVISLDKRAGLRSVHVHRPLSRYIDAILRADMFLTKFIELMPSPEVEKMYPAPWDGPRYILIECSCRK